MLSSEFCEIFRKDNCQRTPGRGLLLSFCFYLFIITLFEVNANKNQLTNIKTFYQGRKLPRKKTLHKTKAQPIFSRCFKLVLSSAVDLLDFIELGSWLHIRVQRKGVEYVPWVDGLAGGRMNTAPFLISYGPSLSMKKDIMSLGLVVTNFPQ